MKNQKIVFTITEEYIELIKLLKATGFADTGGDAKSMVDNNLVKLNGEVENRKRAKVRASDIVETEMGIIQVIANTDDED